MFNVICHQRDANENNNEIPLYTYQNGQNLEHWQHQTLTRMWSNGNSHSLLVGMQNGTATSEDKLAVSNKTKHTLTIQSSNHTPWHLPKGVEHLCLHKNLHVDVYGSFTPNCQNLEATKMSFNWWIGKQTVIHPDNGILSSTKKKWTIKSQKDMEET